MPRDYRHVLGNLSRHLTYSLRSPAARCDSSQDGESIGVAKSSEQIGLGEVGRIATGACGWCLRRRHECMLAQLCICASMDLDPIDRDSLESGGGRRRQNSVIGVLGSLPEVLSGERAGASGPACGRGDPKKTRGTDTWPIPRKEAEDEQICWQGGPPLFVLDAKVAGRRQENVRRTWRVMQRIRRDLASSLHVRGANLRRVGLR